MGKRKSIVLNVVNRGETGKKATKAQRRAGQIPCVIYGRALDNRHVALNASEWRSVGGMDVNLVELKADDGETTNALIKEIQHDYLSDTTLHIDFQEIRMDEKLTTSVPVRVRGAAVGVNKGGILEQVLHELEVTCLPMDLPEELEVEVSELEIGDGVHVGELVLPDGVSTTEAPDHMVVHVIEQAEEEEEKEVLEGEEGVEGEEGAEGEEGEAAASEESKSEEDEKKE